MIPRPAIYLAAFVLWSVAMGWAGWAWRGDRAEADQASKQVEAGAEQVEQVNQARVTEHAQAEVVATIGETHEQDRAAAEAVPATVVADLRAGNLRLRDGWASCETQRLSEAAVGAGERDAATQRREEFASRVVRIGRDADDQLRACQALVRNDRE